MAGGLAVEWALGRQYAVGIRSAYAQADLSKNGFHD